MKTVDTLAIERLIRYAMDQPAKAELWAVTFAYMKGNKNATMSFSMRELELAHNLKEIVRMKYESMIESMEDLDEKVDPDDTETG